MAKVVPDKAANVFDLMVPTSQVSGNDDDVLRANPPLTRALLSVLDTRLSGGELFGLVEKFEAKNQIEKLESWISRGENLPISAAEAREVLGDDFLAKLEENLQNSGYLRAGYQKDNLLENIARVLPAVIRMFTRTGQIPPQRILAQRLADFLEHLKT